MLLGTLARFSTVSFSKVSSSSLLFLARKPVTRAARTMAADTKAHHFETHSTIIWLDCEMSGLDINKDKLLEVAVILTDSSLKEEATLGPLVVKTDKAVLDNMNDWCKKNHGKTGLVKACLESSLTIEEIDEQLYQLLSSKGIRYGVLGGNSVSYDRIFMAKFCPKFSSLLHYRNIDVSSFKEIFR